MKDAPNDTTPETPTPVCQYCNGEGDVLNLLGEFVRICTVCQPAAKPTHPHGNCPQHPQGCPLPATPPAVQDGGLTRYTSRGFLDPYPEGNVVKWEDVKQLASQLAQAQQENTRLFLAEQNLRAEISAAFGKHGLAAGPTAVDRLVEQLAQAQGTIESVQAEYQSVVLKDGEDIKQLKQQLAQAQEEVANLKAGFPDIGPDPLKLPPDEWQEAASEDATKKRITDIYCKQQKGVPDQTALLWRADLSRLMGKYIWRRAQGEHFQACMEKRRELEASLTTAREECERLREESAQIAGCLDWGAISAGRATVLSEVQRTIFALRECQHEKAQQQIKHDMEADTLRAELNAAREECERQTKRVMDVLLDRENIVAERDQLRAEKEELLEAIAPVVKRWMNTTEQTQKAYPKTFEDMERLRAALAKHQQADT